jgi:phospholipid transport system substrate-binding protein
MIRNAICCFALCLFASNALATEPKAVIEERYKEIHQIISTEKTDDSVRTKVLSVLESFTDFEEFGRLTIKRYWKDLSAKQRTLFVGKFRLLIHRSYSKRFKANQTLDLSFRGDAEVIGDKALVKTTVVSGKSEAEVDYKLHKKGDTFMAYDIVIDEVSLMRSYRKQFKRIMKRESSTRVGFDKLIEKMTKKIDEGAGEIDDP